MFMFRRCPVHNLERSRHLLEVSSTPSSLLTCKQTIDGPKSSWPRCPFKSTDSVKTAAQTVATCMSRAQETATEKCQSILGALLALFIVVVSCCYVVQICGGRATQSKSVVELWCA